VKACFVFIFWHERSSAFEERRNGGSFFFAE